MDELAVQMMRNAKIMVGDRMAAGALVVVLIGMILYREDRKSSRWLFVTVLLQTIQLVADAATYSYSLDPTLPYGVAAVLYFIAYAFSNVLVITFIFYAKAYIEEKTPVPEWLFAVPVGLEAIALIISCAAIFSGRVYGNVDGLVTSFGSIPAVNSVLQFIVILYIPAASATQIKKIGWKAVLLLGLFGILPGVTLLVSYDYSLMTGALAVLIVYILLQCDISAAREKQREDLAEMNARLEESAAEQAARIKEITALNTQLEDNQSQLEESAAEQESQIEEITALNAQLQTDRDEREKSIAVIEALSDAYQNVYLLNEKTETAEIIKLDGYVTSGMEDRKGPYPYAAACRAYISGRVYEEDVPAVTEAMSLERVLQGTAGSGTYEYSYRVLEDGAVHFCQGHYRRIEGGYIVIGFRNIDALIAEEAEKNAELEKARKEAESANNAKTSFLFNMSHDIRTPMNAIIGFRDLLEKHQDDPEKRADYLRKIRDASTVLLSIINNVLEMARIEKGTLEITESVWGAEQFNDSLYSVFQEMMEKKGLTFTRHTDVQHPYIYCDPVKLREIFINILGNACKYTNAGGTVDMSVKELPYDREGWVLYRTTISDTGIGMSREFLPHLFEEFSRENNTTDAKVEGTGLGMPIVKRLVEILGGTIEVQSEKGRGSTFIVTIPHRIAARPDAAGEDIAEAEPAQFEGKRILLAEDNELNAEIAMEILGEAGFLMERAEDGAVCLEMLQNAAPGYYDLILMDIQMPNMNGYEATRAIRALPDPARAQIRIIAMTANAFEEDRREALNAGMNGHLAKPINIAELMKTLAEILK